MKVEKIAIYYPNGQVMMQMGPIEGSVDDIIKISAAGLEDIISKMPELTQHARGMFQAYEDAKNKTS
jgi:hypothetical protein